MTTNGFDINDAESFAILFITIGMILVGTIPRTMAVKVQIRERRRRERTREVLSEDEFTLPFWARMILFPVFMFSKKPFLKRTILYRFWNLIFTFIVIFVCFLSIDARFKGYDGLSYILGSLALMVIFRQNGRDWGRFS